MKEYKITSGFFDRERRLVLTESHVEYENADLKGEEFVRLDKSDIVDFRHGMDEIVWYKLTVGRQFSITFNDKKNRELKISFNSYFGLRRENNQLYSNIVATVWKYYHSDIVNTFLDKFYNGEELEIQGIKLNQEGVRLRGESTILTWDKISIKEYFRYFALYHRDNPDIHSWASYNEYGTETLWSLMKTILKENAINSPPENT